jgi:hypothetical protein
MAANALLDRGWGKAAQLAAVDGEIRQLVEVKLNVVHSPSAVTSAPIVYLEHEKPNDINDTHVTIVTCCLKRRATLSNSAEGSGPSSGRGRRKFWQGDPVKTTLDHIAKLAG